MVFFPSWTRSTAGEVQAWLGYVFFLLPAGACFALGISPFIEKTVLRALKGLDGFCSRRALVLALGMSVMLAVVARLINIYVFREFPFTDDEWGIRFGGQVLASGRFMVPIPHSIEALPSRFLFGKDGFYTSFDWPGALGVPALGIVSGLGNAVYALVAGLVCFLMLLCAAQLLNRRYAALAAFFLLSSPMMILISGSTHAQNASRLWIALCLCSYAFF
ncbi:MAG: hypothetical protein IPJ88_12025 [Myxococcales bacterium]|nr:MAG: hypothetical protein IPJ88_12025 [Myxococcales bacterium]